MLMRVLHWYPNFCGGGAVANLTLFLAEAQARLGAEVLLAAAAAEGEPLYEPPSPAEAKLLLWQPLVRFQTGSLVLRGLRREDARRLRAFRPDVVHAHGEFNPDNLRLPQLFGSSLVLAPQGAFHPGVFMKRRRRSKLAYARLARLLLYRHVTCFHATSPDEAEHVRSMFPGARVYVAPNLALFDTRPRVRSASEGALRLIFVGRLDVFTKGLDLLLAAVAAARARLEPTQVRLTLVGPDELGGRAVLERQVSERGLDDVVEFTGVLPRAQVDERLGESDLYIQLSRHEALSLSTIEALLAPLPVILTGTGIASFAEIASLPHVAVVPTEAGAAADAIVDAAMRLPELATEAERARGRVAEFFSWRRVAETHFAAYRAAAARGPLP